MKIKVKNSTQTDKFRQKKKMKANKQTRKHRTVTKKVLDKYGW